MITTKCSPYLRRGQPAHRGALINNDDYTIVATCGAEYRGLVQYYLLAGDVHRLHRLEWVMKTSMLKTLAGKRRSTVTKDGDHTQGRDRDTARDAHLLRSPRRTRRQETIGCTVRWHPTQTRSRRQQVRVTYPHKELIKWVLANTCELCRRTDDIEVHHVRALADLAVLGQPHPDWARIMTKRRRKTLVVCDSRHDRIHNRQPAAPLTQ